jgi:NADH dehydrogenase/NADH:ubiquinone oxidoreductase subunit G
MNKQPLLDIMKDDIDRIVDENVKQVKKEADDRLRKEKEEADDRLKKEKEEADARLKEADVRLKKTSASHIKKIMNTFGVPIEKAMDILLIPQSDKELYTRLVQNM